MGSIASRIALGSLLIAVWLVSPRGANAQPLGPFSWQLGPFCNVVTLTTVQQGASFALSGFDDNCGGPTRSAVFGSAFFNPDGTVGLGFSIASPGRAATQIAAVLSLATGSGTWSDSRGQAGALTIGPSIPTSGGPRPIDRCPPDAVPAGSACVDKYEASVWQTTDAAVIQMIKLGTVTQADLVAAGAVQRGVATTDYGVAGCQSTGAGCGTLYAVSIPGVVPSRSDTA